MGIMIGIIESCHSECLLFIMIDWLTD